MPTYANTYVAISMGWRWGEGGKGAKGKVGGGGRRTSIKNKRSRTTYRTRLCKWQLIQGRVDVACSMSARMTEHYRNCRICEVHVYKLTTGIQQVQIFRSSHICNCVAESRQNRRLWFCICIPPIHCYPSTKYTFQDILSIRLASILEI
jgi:hypothetical protein